MAGVLASFMPVLDSLTDLQAKYGNDEFGKGYNAMEGIMRQVFTDLGSSEYTIATGDAIDKSRMDVVDAVYSEEFPANTVIEPLTMGWELQGNVIRSAQCVASLGSQAAVEEEEEEAAEELAEEESDVN